MAPLTRSWRERGREGDFANRTNALWILVPSFVSEPPFLPLSSSFSSLGRHAFTFLGRPCVACIWSLAKAAGAGDIFVSKSVHSLSLFPATQLPKRRIRARPPSRLAIYFCACCRRRKLLSSNSMTTLRSQSHANAHTLFRLANSQQFAYIRPIHDYNARRRRRGAMLRDRRLWDTRCLPPNRGCSTRFSVGVFGGPNTVHPAAIPLLEFILMVSE